MYRKEIMAAFKVSRADAIQIRKLIASDSAESQNYASGTQESREAAKKTMLDKVAGYKGSEAYQSRGDRRKKAQDHFGKASRAIVYNKGHALNNDLITALAKLGIHAHVRN